MPLIDFKSLWDRQAAIKETYQSKKPFRYVVFDHIFFEEAADLIERSYPPINDGSWEHATYVDQKNKFQRTKFEQGSVMEQVFSELNSAEFVKWLEGVTGVEEHLIVDESLFGSGLHQSTTGAFLNVHVDYNVHPKTGLHRRFNVLVYMNKGWKDEYAGHLEMWDLTNGDKKLLDKVSPSFNRCVIFETNEISFHGHPSPLRSPQGVNRKSLACYYYTKNRPTNEIVSKHDTIYANTEGLKGQLKRFTSGLKALSERLKS